MNDKLISEAAQSATENVIDLVCDSTESGTPTSDIVVAVRKVALCIQNAIDVSVNDRLHVILSERDALMTLLENAHYHLFHREESCADLLDEIRRTLDKDKRIAELEELLRSYGEHQGVCPCNVTGLPSSDAECTCGWGSVLHMLSLAGNDEETNAVVDEQNERMNDEANNVHM